MIKIYLSRIWCSHITKFINVLGFILVERHTFRLIMSLIDTRWQLSVLDIWSFRGIICDTDDCLVVAKLGRVSKKTSNANIWYREIYLKKLMDAEVKEQCQVNIWNRFAVLEYLDDNVDVSKAWESITENIKT
jgi:hypothetical protein